MKTNKKILGGLIVTVVASSFYFFFGADMITKYKEEKKNIAFDNSKPGLWEIKTVSSFLDDKTLNKENSLNICVTDKMISDSKNKTLEEKLDVNGLKCEKNTKRISKEVGEFDLTCTGTNPVNNRNVVAKISGKIDSKVESGKLEISYSIDNGVDEELKFNIKTESKRIGDCQEDKLNEEKE